MTASELATAAEGLVGTRFRLHGRDPATGLDCIGLFAAALAGAEPKVDLPTGYTLRLTELSQWLPEPARTGFAEAAPPFEPGDVVLLRPSAAQVHLAIAGHTGWVHAHAGLRRVVRQPEKPFGEVLHHWRLIPQT